MILKSLHLENFKGTKDKTYEFGKSTRVSGMNRIGKTTIATAWFWLLADKNYELVSNPNIRPDDVEECVPTVTAVLDVDSKEITIAKMQKRKVSKPDANGIHTRSTACLRRRETLELIWKNWACLLTISLYARIRMYLPGRNRQICGRYCLS